MVQDGFFIATKNTNLQINHLKKGNNFQIYGTVSKLMFLRQCTIGKIKANQGQA